MLVVSNFISWQNNFFWKVCKLSENITHVFQKYQGHDSVTTNFFKNDVLEPCQTSMMELLFESQSAFTCSKFNNWNTGTRCEICLQLTATAERRYQACNFIKKRLQHRCVPVNIATLLRTPILKNICERLLL